MLNLEKRVAAVERSKTHQNYASMSIKQLGAYRSDTSRSDWMAALMERIWRNGSRLPMNTLNVQLFVQGLR